MALAFFCLTYLFIAGFRIPPLHLDRAGGALLGAVLMVAFGVVSPAEVVRMEGPAGPGAIDWRTIVLLLGMMILSGALTEAAFFRTVGYHAVRRAKSPRMLLVVVAATSAVLSAFMVNDTVCLMLTPLVLAVAEESKLPAEPYLLALAMGANAGSAATFTGNPQNMLIQGASGLGYARFFAFMALPALCATALVAAVLLFVYRRELPKTPIHPHAPPPPLDRRVLWVALPVGGLVVAGFFAGLSMSACAIVGAVAVLAFGGRPARVFLEKVDYVLLLFFASLFVVVYGVDKEGWMERMFRAVAPLLSGGAAHQAFGLGAVTTLLSNVFSNVPFVMLAKAWIPNLGRAQLGWHTLALTSTLAGNLTLVGSVANLIVFELARHKSPISFMRYLRVGLPATLLSVTFGLLVLLLEHALVG